MAGRPSHHHGRRRVHEEQLYQSFTAPSIPNSFHHTLIQHIIHDAFRTVSYRAIKTYYTVFDRIERFEDPQILSIPLQHPPLRPRRIRAYPDNILRVHVSPEDRGKPLGTGQPKPNDDDEDDDEDMPGTSPDNPDPGQGGDGAGAGAGDGAGGEPFDDLDDDQGGDQDVTDYSLSGDVLEYGPDGNHMLSLRLSPLTCPPVGSAETRPSRSPVFFALPVGNTLPIEQCSWKVFMVCTCASTSATTRRWIPHLINEQSYKVIRDEQVASFIDLLGPVLVSNAYAFLTDLGIVADPSDADPAPMSDRNRALTHLCAELGLESNEDTERHLQKTINDLNTRIFSPNESASDATLKLQRLRQSDLDLFASFLHEKEQDAKAISDDQDGHPDAYVTAASLGQERFVCYHHYQQLHSGIVRDYVEEQTERAAEYNIHTGRISATITSGEALAQLCSIDSTKIGFVSEFDVRLQATDAWEASVDEIHGLHAFAVRLGITTMTISGNTSGGVEEEETNHVRALLKDAIGDLTRVSVIWDSKLDISTLIQEAAGTREQLLYLSIKDSSQEVLSVMRNGYLGVRHVKSSLDDFPLVSGRSFLAGKAQSLEIPLEWSTEIQGRITQIIKESLAFTTLTLDCKSRGHDFKRAIREINDIRESLDKPDPQNPAPSRLPFRHVILKDRTDNDATAWFDLMQTIPEDDSFLQPVALDVTSRYPPVVPFESSTTASSGGSMPQNQTVSSLLKAYGSVVRVLHLIGPNPACLSLLADLLDSATDPEKLVSLTLRLDHLRENHVDELFDILSSSKNTFKQLALVGRPQDNGEDKAATKLLKALKDLDETVKGIQVLATRTKIEGIDEWIAEVESATKETSSTLIVVESAKEFGEIVPSLTEKGLATLEAIFTSSEPVNVVKDEQLVVEIGDPKKY